MTPHVQMILNVPRVLGSGVHGTYTWPGGGTGVARTQTANRNSRSLSIITSELIQTDFEFGMLGQWPRFFLLFNNQSVRICASSADELGCVIFRKIADLPLPRTDEIKLGSGERYFSLAQRKFCIYEQWPVAFSEHGS